MADTSSNWENLCTFYLHLSPIYICSSLFTCLALFWTWWSCQKSSYGNESNYHDWKPRDSSVDSSRFKSKLHFDDTEQEHGKVDTDRTKDEYEENIKSNKEPSMMKHLKSARHQVIEKQLTAGLSKEQLQIEKETQASQLEAIYRLLKEKEDKFNIHSMDELQEQLKLYK